MNPIMEIPANAMRERRQPTPASGSANSTIRAKDIMTTDVVTVRPETTVHDIALLLADRHLSAVPVVNGDSLLGIVSEGDLMRRQELGTETDRACPAAPADEVAVRDCARSFGMLARDAMTRDVATVGEDAPLAEIAKTLDARRIGRVLVTRRGRLVGIVSHADIVRALAVRREGSHGPACGDDDMIRYKVIETLFGVPGASAWSTTVRVSNGVVELVGSVEDEAARETSRLAVEGIAFVVEVRDRRAVLQPYWG